MIIEVTETNPQRVLVLLVLPSDGSIPAGETVQSITMMMRDKVDWINSFWSEASYNKVSFVFDIHAYILNLNRTMTQYYRWPKPKLIDASGATYPITWPASKTLQLRGQNNFDITVTFSGASQRIEDIVNTINNAVRAQFTGPAGDIPIIAHNNSSGQLRLQTSRQHEDAVLDIVGGDAVSDLGLGSGSITVTNGVSLVDGRPLLVPDALNKFVEGLPRDRASNLLRPFRGIIVAVVAAAGDNPLRAAALQSSSFDVNTTTGTLQIRCSWMGIHTSNSRETLAHEMGHMFGFGDLYDEPGGTELAGEEPGHWDIMSSGSNSHPTMWIKHWETRNRTITDADRATRVSWIPTLERMPDPLSVPVELMPMDPPAPNTRRELRVLLAPTEAQLPSNNPFSTTHPNIRLTHAIQIKVDPFRSFYVENRQRPFSSSPIFGTSLHSSTIPESGVIVTDAQNSVEVGEMRTIPPWELPSPRGWVVMATPYNDSLNMINEERIVHTFSPTNNIKAKIMDKITGPPDVYDVLVTWGEGSSYNAVINAWRSPPPWESSDIWVDTQVNNGWDVYSHSDARIEPSIRGNPILNGDRIRPGWPVRLYARVWNYGDIAVSNVEVKFQVAIPAGMGPISAQSIGRREINLPARNPDGTPSYAVTLPVEWSPRNPNEGHVCVRVIVTPKPNESNDNDNMAQENFTDWELRGSSPYEPVQFPFQVANPLPRRAQIWLQAQGLEPGWFMDVDPVRFWLEPGQTIEGMATIRADDSVPFEKEGIPSPMITLEARVERGDTWVRFGGISGIAHAVRRTNIDSDVKVQENKLDVYGNASTAEGPVRDTNVTIRLSDSDMIEVQVDHIRTNNDGNFSYTTAVSEKVHNLEIVISPTLGTSSAYDLVSVRT